MFEKRERAWKARQNKDNRKKIDAVAGIEKMWVVPKSWRFLSTGHWSNIETRTADIFSFFVSLLELFWMCPRARATGGLAFSVFGPKKVVCKSWVTTFHMESTEVMFLAAYAQLMVFKLQGTRGTSYYGNAEWSALWFWKLRSDTSRPAVWSFHYNSIFLFTKVSLTVRIP